MQLSAAETILALQAEVLALTAERDAALATLYVRNDEYDALALTLQLRDDQVVRTQRALMIATAAGEELTVEVRRLHAASRAALPPSPDDRS